MYYCVFIPHAGWDTHTHTHTHKLTLSVDSERKVVMEIGDLKV